MAADSYLAPVLLPSLSTSLNPSDPFSTIVSVSNQGHLSIRAVEVYSGDNLIIFSNGDAFRGPDAKMAVSYTSNEVSPGESFAFPLGEFARLFVLSPNEKVVSLGDPELPGTPLIRFSGPHGRHRVTVDQNHPNTHFSMDQERNAVSADLWVNIVFHSALMPFQSSKHFRFSTLQADDGHLAWKPSPSSEGSNRNAKLLTGDVLTISDKPIVYQGK